MSRKGPKGPLVILPPAPLPVPMSPLGYYLACAVYWTEATHSPEEQMELLGITRRRVTDTRTRLRKAGLQVSYTHEPATPITEAEYRRVVSLIQNGLTCPEIDELLEGAPGRAWRILKKYRTSHKAVLKARPFPLYTALDLADALGVGREQARVWLHRGWIRADRPNDAHWTRWRIEHTDVLEFLRNRRYWMFYQPEQIVVPLFRRVAEIARAEQPGRWWTVGEIAEALHFTKSAIRRWLGHGWPGPRWEVVTLQATRYVWVPKGSPLPDALVMSRQRRRPPCVRCTEREQRTRGLCERCAAQARRRGALDEWGLPRARPYARAAPAAAPCFT